MFDRGSGSGASGHHDLFRPFRKLGQIENIIPTMPNLTISHKFHEPRHLILDDGACRARELSPPDRKVFFRAHCNTDFAAALTML